MKRLKQAGRFVFIIIITAAVLVLNSCVKKEITDISTAPPEELQTILKRKEIQTFLVYQGEELQWSYIVKGWDRENLHNIHSCAKSIVSLLIGILIDSGSIKSVEVPVYTLFPSHYQKNIPEENKTLRLRHFLTMTTGLKTRDSYQYRWAGLRGISNKYNWVNEILTLPMEAPAGRRFDYSNLSSFLLGELVRTSTGKDVSLYAEEVLFDPLDIEAYKWNKNHMGQSTGWGGLFLKPSDLAKIGFLVMNRGKWKGEQIVSASWIEQSTSALVSPDTLMEHYGYHWWIDSADRILALGYQGQYLIIDRELDLVTVFASSLDDLDFFLPYELYLSLVIPAFR
jgi:CubicO group peptidase (beta-lactamase class C family)